MAKKDHLVKFQVENFKRFRKLRLENLGQFNLIVGDNNVGKTSVLEALLYDDEHDKWSYNLYKALSYRNLGGEYKEGHLDFYINKSAQLSVRNNEVEVRFWYQVNSDIEPPQELSEFGKGRDFLYDKFGNLKSENFLLGTISTINRSDLKILDSIPFIPFSMAYGKDLMDIYSRVYIRDRAAKRNLIKVLMPLISDIDDLELDTAITDYPVLVIAKNNSDSVVPLVSYGEGTIKLFRILMFILIFKGDRLMIDEIDTGIHYSRMKDFWRTILKAAEENEVQLFVTTHNQECIRYFKEVLEEKEMEHLQKEARTITLVENAKTKDVEALTSGFEELDYSLTVGNEVR